MMLNLRSIPNASSNYERILIDGLLLNFHYSLNSRKIYRISTLSTIVDMFDIAMFKQNDDAWSTCKKQIIQMNFCNSEGYII